MFFWWKFQSCENFENAEKLQNIQKTFQHIQKNLRTYFEHQKCWTLVKKETLHITKNCLKQPQNSLKFQVKR